MNSEFRFQNYESMEKNSYFSERRLGEIERKIELLQREKRRKITDPRFIFLDNSEFMRLLGISDNTATAWRRQGKIKHSLVGRRIYYRLSDISKMIKNHAVKALKIKKDD